MKDLKDTPARETRDAEILSQVSTLENATSRDFHKLYMLSALLVEDLDKWAENSEKLAELERNFIPDSDYIDTMERTQAQVYLHKTQSAYNKARLKKLLAELSGRAI